MPGERLTAEDRRRIAEGLAAGLTYAEIARRLGRSRSTVTREIARNGGPHGYRAARAQHATSWRARRRKSAPHATAPAAARDREAPTVREFEERFAVMMTETGMAPMTARVFAALFISEGGSLTATELVQRLQVSPATISHAVRWLEQRELVTREREARRVRYIVDAEVWYRAWAASTRSMARWAAAARQGAEIFGTDTPTGDRLHTTGRFFELLGHDMAQAAEHWRQALSTRRRR
ncbi:DNA-binding MarR family transcriptional regulator [Nonomuraea thailandensis]|uniref:DNA-binding MarR family transcriptional regulator n=1 Tax=Nonomuraea thailandensis TaxID=1188745 RepID=A0A9X2K1R6_9ACTN|nr:helix-turn-helix domain-containing protein [Nonomuraea thailandensis]MCP2356275.1 DNA-binding MarR family transcriptional regulator [Nonomuraea thailandensis]